MDRQAEIMVWTLVFAASINNSKSVQGATQNADQGLAAFKARFDRKEADED